MSGVATAIIGSAVVGAVVSNNSANKGAAAMKDASNASNALASSQFDQTRADQAPWRAAGETALGQLSALTANGGDLNRRFTMADFQQDPGYAFRMQEGQKALERSGAAKGMTLSGAQSKALTAYGQNQGSQEYQAAFGRFNTENNNMFSRLSSIAGLGQQANAANQQASQNYVTNYTNNTMGAGNASAAASIAGGNAIQSGINSGINGWNNYNMWNSLQGVPSPTMSTVNAPVIPDMPAGRSF